MVLACEKGDLDSVKAFIEGHDVEKTGMSVDDMAVRKERIVVADHAYLYLAVRKEQFEIVQYLVKVVLQWTSLGRRIVMVE